jgi:hypothetical protein
MRHLHVAKFKNIVDKKLIFWQAHQSPDSDGRQKWDRQGAQAG